jgi:hypothetical protein
MPRRRFKIFERLPGYASLYLASVADLRILCDDLERHKDYQILVGKREADGGDMIEIFISFGPGIRGGEYG